MGSDPGPLGTPDNPGQPGQPGPPPTPGYQDGSGKQLWLFSEAAEPVPGDSPAEAQGTALPALENSILQRYPRKRVAIVYTRNRTVILSLKARPDGELTLRAHECFRHAPEEVCDAVARLYLGRPPRPGRRALSLIVSTWHQKSAQPPASKDPAELVCGSVHNLPTVLDIVNRSYFSGTLDMDISYGQRTARRLMGRHEARHPRSLILINPILDNPKVKAWYVHYLVFHECLHEVIPPRPSRGRLLLHPPEFRRRERMHPDIDAARKYEGWLTGAGYRRLLRDHRKKQNQAAKASTALPTAARRTRRNQTGRKSTGGASP